MMRSLSKDDYFYMTVFSYFNKDPNARRIVGLLANSVTTNQYQCAFREGGGMAIAALARISQWKKTATLPLSSTWMAPNELLPICLEYNTNMMMTAKKTL
jgi:hypothetical protein